MGAYLVSISRYYIACIKQAARGTFKFAHSYRWLIGGIVVSSCLWILGYTMQIPNDWLGGVISGGILLAATLSIVFLGRLILVAPFELHRDAVAKANESEKRRIEMMSDPHVVIHTDKDPLVVEREDLPESEGKPPGLFIVYRDIRITNRGNSKVSVEFKLKIVVEERFSILADQTTVRAWSALKEEEDFKHIIGQMLPEVSNVDQNYTQPGTLVFFIPMHNPAGSVIRQITGRMFPGNIGDFVADHCGKEITVTDILSGQTAEFDASGAFSYILRRDAFWNEGVSGR
jgi:hypothetical protein